MSETLPLITECSRCGGHGVEDRMGRNFTFAACRKCGGSGDLFNGMPFSEWQQGKDAAPTDLPHAEAMTEGERERSEG